ncbi:hypothetical protein D3C78_1495040 [compost metagenome]
MAVVTKVDVSLDLQHPVREISDVITLVLSMHPGREVEILRQIDEEVGNALALLEKPQAEQV